MASFIVYNKNTGDILRTGCCPTTMLNLQKHDDIEDIIVGTADDECDKINLETKEVMKDHIISRQGMQEELDRKLKEEAPMRAREGLIEERIKQNARNKAMQELINEGIIEENKL